MKQQFWTVDAVTGSGKTTAALDYAATLPTTNFCIIMPTKRLIARAIAEFRERHPSVAKRLKVITSKRGQTESVARRITQFVEETQERAGAILFITHEAFMRMRYWHLKKNWHVIVDEVLGVTYHETFTLDENRNSLLSLLQLAPHDTKWSFVEPRDSARMKSMATNRKQDQVTALFSALAGKMVDSSHWQLYVDTAAYREFVHGTRTQLEVHGLLHPGIFDGFASVTLMAANLGESLMIHHFANIECRFEPHARITSRLRYRDHTNGERLLICYLTERSWSKNLRDLPITHEGQQKVVGELYLELVRTRFANQPYLWIGNCDLDDDVLDGVRLPNVPHGLNDYQGYHLCAVVSALNPSEAHGLFLRTMAKIDERQVRRALLSQVAYQALGRGSLRNPTADGPFVLIVPDRDTADDVASMYPGCRVELLLGHDPIPAKKQPGRQKVNMSRADTNRAAARRRDWRTKQSHLIHVCTIGEKAEMTSEGFYVSRWKTQTSKRYDEQGFMTTDEFVAFLRRRMEYEFSSKDSVPLFIPAKFDLTRDPAHGHSNANVVRKHGLVIDMDSTPHTPAEIVRVLGGIRLIITSSYSNSPENWRYRLYIPTARAMTPDVSQAILLTLSEKLGGEEYGVDTSKFAASSMMRLPCKTEFTIFEDYAEGRQAIDPAEWLKELPPHVVDKVIGNFEIAEPVEVAPVEGYANWQQVGFEKARGIWHAACATEGKGDHAFHRFGWRLHGYRMALPDIQATLLQEAHHARSAKDRLDQIPRIIDSIRHRG